MDTHLRNFIKYNVLNTSEVAELLEVSRQRVKVLVDEKKIIPVKKNSNGYLFLRNDILNYRDAVQGKHLPCKRKELLFDRSGTTRSSEKFILEHINEIDEISSVLIYFEGLDAILDGYFQVDDIAYGFLHNVSEPTMVIKDIKGKELWLSGCNCGYIGTGPNGSIRVLKGLWKAGKINLEKVSGLEDIIYNHKVVKIIQEKNKFVDVIKHQGSFSKRDYRLNDITADLYYFKDNLVLLQSDPGLYDDDQIALLDKFRGFIPDPVSAMIFPTKEEAIRNGYSISNYGLMDELIFQVIIQDYSGRELWLNTLLDEHKPIEKQDSVLSILEQCGIFPPEKSMPTKIVEWFNKEVRKEVGTPVIFKR